MPLCGAHTPAHLGTGRRVYLVQRRQRLEKGGIAGTERADKCSVPILSSTQHKPVRHENSSLTPSPPPSQAAPHPRAAHTHTITNLTPVSSPPHLSSFPSLVISFWVASQQQSNERDIHAFTLYTTTNCRHDTRTPNTMQTYPTALLRRTRQLPPHSAPHYT